MTLYKPLLTLFALASIISGGCKVADGVIPVDPATEAQGRNSIKSGISQAMNEKGYGVNFQEDVMLYTNKQGKFDVVGFIDVDNDGDTDFRLGGNYLTGNDSEQGINDTSRVKTKEIYQSDVTTPEYLNSVFYEWANSTIYSD